MGGRAQSRHRSALRPLAVILGAIGLFSYGTVALLSQDPLWFLSRAEIPDPQRIVIRVDGEETVLTPSAADYDLIVGAMREALSGFKNWAPGSTGLSEATLTEYQNHGIVLEFYFVEPVDFHLPFNDGNPTALLVPIQGRHGGEGYVFRGKHGSWWAGQLIMSNAQALNDALSALGYVQH
jgi:hypothetical protein